MNGPPRYHIAFANRPQFNWQPWQNEQANLYQGLPFLASHGSMLPPREHFGHVIASSCVNGPRFQRPQRQVPLEVPLEVQQYLNSDKSIGNHNICQDVTSKMQVDTPEQIAKWREERKRNYPTLSNVAKKQEEQKQRNECGQVLLNKEFRYNNKQGWKNRRGKRGSNRRGRGKFNQGFTEPRVLQQHNQPNERVTTTLKENVSAGVNSDKTQLVENNTNETVMHSGALGALAAVYAASSSDEDDCDKNKEQFQTEYKEKYHQTEDQNQETDPCPVQESKKMMLTKSVVDNNGNLGEKKNYPKRIKKKRKQNVIQNLQRPSLLEMLLAPEIRRERNIVLQCLRYIVKKDFFGIGCEDNVND